MHTDRAQGTMAPSPREGQSMGSLPSSLQPLALERSRMCKILHLESMQVSNEGARRTLNIVITYLYYCSYENAACREPCTMIWRINCSRRFAKDLCVRSILRGCPHFLPAPGTGAIESATKWGMHIEGCNRFFFSGGSTLKSRALGRQKPQEYS
jgi:hypothetical protein